MHISQRVLCIQLSVDGAVGRPPLRSPGEGRVSTASSLRRVLVDAVPYSWLKKTVKTGRRTGYEPSDWPPLFALPGHAYSTPS